MKRFYFNSIKGTEMMALYFSQRRTWNSSGKNRKKGFNEREFIETINTTDWDEILLLNRNDPNLSIDKLCSQVNYLLDEFAPYKKSSKKAYKLKSKPWIFRDIQFLMWERDKSFHKYCKEDDQERRENFHIKYTSLRNQITQRKRESKTDYYKSYFANNTSKVANIWKGIRSLIKIKLSASKDILILDDDGKIETDPTKISNIFNKTFVSLGPKIDEQIPPGKLHYSEYLKDIRINNRFILRPATSNEMYDIILALDLNKSLGPNSLPIFIMKICNDFFFNLFDQNYKCLLCYWYFS